MQEFFKLSASLAIVIVGLALTLRMLREQFTDFSWRVSENVYGLIRELLAYLILLSLYVWILLQFKTQVVPITGLFEHLLALHQELSWFALGFWLLCTFVLNSLFNFAVGQKLARDLMRLWLISPLSFLAWCFWQVSLASLLFIAAALAAPALRYWCRGLACKLAKDNSAYELVNEILTVCLALSSGLVLYANF